MIENDGRAESRGLYVCVAGQAQFGRELRRFYETFALDIRTKRDARRYQSFQTRTCQFYLKNKPDFKFQTKVIRLQLYE